MTANVDKKNYEFTKSNPEFLAAWRTCGLFMAVLTAVVVGLRLVDILPNNEVLWWELFIVVFGLTWLGIWILPRWLGAGIRVCPEFLLIQKWPPTNRVFLPWQDIGSIRLGTWHERGRLNLLYAMLAFGKYSRTPYIVIETKKMVTMPFLTGRTTTARAGIPVGKTFRFYIDDPEEFVENARRFLQPPTSFS